MAVNVKMGVDLNGFKSEIRNGQNILKGLNAEMKAAEAEFKATGNAEQLLTNKTNILNQQIRVQKGVATEAEKALKAMTDAGVDPADAAYQRLYATMMNATAGMNNAQAELNALGTSAQKTATDADKLTTSVNNIGKKISLEQVISGIDRITDGLETAAKKAVQLGETIWNSIMDSAKWADDTMTQAAMFGIDVETFQKMQKLVASGLDTTVESMLRSQQKFKKNIGEGKDEFMLAMKELGLTVEVYGGKTGEAMSQLVTEDQMDLFFRAGQAIMNLGDEYEKEAVAQKLFGKSWRELVPLFTDYKSVEEYTAALDKQKVVEEELVENGADLYDQVGELKENLKTLKDDILLSLAPALTDAAEALNGLLTSVLDYLKTPEGKQMLQDLGTAVSGLFDDLGKIEPEKVVEGFTGVFNTVVGSVQWLVENKDGVVEALKWILGGWAMLTVSGGVLDIVKLISGIKGLTTAGAAEAGAAAGASWGGAFASAVMKAAPWLIGLYTLLNPASTGDTVGNNITIDESGKLTGEAELYGYNQNEAGETYLDRRQIIEDAAQTAWDLYRTNQFDAAALSALKEKVMSEAGFNDLVDLFMGTRNGNENWKSIEDLDLTEWANKYGLPEIPIDLTPATDASEIAEEVGPVKLPVILSFSGGGRSADVLSQITGHANGLPFVQNDGLYLLHKGETVTPAREVQSRSYNSNLYVESMYMNNGTDAAGLASAMAAAQQRTMSGYGS